MPRGKDRWAKVRKSVEKQHPSYSEEHLDRMTAGILRKDGWKSRSSRNYKRKRRK